MSMEKLLFLIFIILYSNVKDLQAFTFSDVHPIVKVDSLNKWLENHKEPSTERLKNLIILERSYTWSNINKLLSHTEEINKLSNQFDDEVGRGAYFYIRAFYFNRHKQYQKAFSELENAITIFEKLKDSGGLLHCYGLALTLQYTPFGENKTQAKIFKKNYTEYIELHYKRKPTPHNYLYYQAVKLLVEYGENGAKSAEKLEKMSNQAIDFIKKQPKLSYGYFRVYIFLAIGYYFQNRTLDSYQLNKKAERILAPNQTHERGVIYYNLSNDCVELNKIEEGIEYCRKGLSIVDKYEPLHYVSKSALYGNLRTFMIRKNRFEEVISIDDSVLKYERLSNQQSNDIKMLELQAKYEFDARQKEITTLKETERRSFILLLVAGLVIIGVGILGYNFYKVNKELKIYTTSREQLFGMIAHDLRRPMHAFHGMTEAIGYCLKKKDYKSIERLAHSLDESGLAIQRILENLLSWVISQNQLLPYNPTEVLLSELLMNVVELYQKVGVNKSVLFEVTCQEGMKVYADPNAIELIVRNLLDNSYKAMMPEGKIELYAHQIDTKYIELIISDNGKGIDADKLAVIRKVFSNPQKAFVGTQGMGLGLIMVARFVKRNRGSISVVSNLSVGTTFKLQFPARLATTSKG
ncbi:sensor histidine kinase [Runella sp. SP2]|nr:sensor histidine kinase [Runella sp. SP2]